LITTSSERSHKPMKAASQTGIAATLKRHPRLALAGVGILVLIVWLALPGKRRAPTGVACMAKDACESGICLPDADPKEVGQFVELIKAYAQGQNANPVMVGKIDDLLAKIPHSSLTLRPVYPGVCTERCSADADCPDHMFCTEAVWVGMIRGVEHRRVRVCMPDNHPAVRLIQLRKSGR